jgi:hypothetical protein
MLKAWQKRIEKQREDCAAGGIIGNRGEYKAVIIQL